MSDIQALFSATLALFKMEFTLYGFTFSFWQVFLFVIIGGMVLRFIGGLFDD